ncbi:MAG TPA: MFS transporter [Thermoleophilaceae bacterium]|nr:MFS transporter [Thermoleophilaceae bacterium]
MSRGSLTGSDEDTALAAKWPSIALLAVCEVLAMALWFSASAVVPALRLEYPLDDLRVSLITSSVSAGFVAGTLASALLGLADRFDPRRLLAASATVAAGANAAILLVEPTSLALPALRFVVGACAAGIYPVGMKMAASWARGDMGLLVGLLVGALTLGSASPHLIAALGGGLDWRVTLAASSAFALLAALLIHAVQLGPNRGGPVAFKARYVLLAWTNRPLRLANLGYFGHMWELYAVWGWIGVFLHASFALDPGGEHAALYAKLAAFGTIGIGALGCLAGGLVADRLGRTTLTMVAMAVSGACCVLAGFLFGAEPWLLAALCLVWGVAMVADSAQFSSSVIELSERELIGTMVTVQTCVGFLITLVTIHLIPTLVDLVTWRYAFAFLAIGPFLGVLAMGRLRRHPESFRLAGGNR